MRRGDGNAPGGLADGEGGLNSDREPRVRRKSPWVASTASSVARKPRVGKMMNCWRSFLEGGIRASMLRLTGLTNEAL